MCFRKTKRTTRVPIAHRRGSATRPDMRGIFICGGRPENSVRPRSARGTPKERSALRECWKGAALCWRGRSRLPGRSQSPPMPPPAPVIGRAVPDQHSPSCVSPGSATWCVRHRASGQSLRFLPLIGLDNSPLWYCTPKTTLKGTARHRYTEDGELARASDSPSSGKRIHEARNESGEAFEGGRPSSSG
jgi:hypothetical protein